MTLIILLLIAIGIGLAYAGITGQSFNDLLDLIRAG